MFASKQSVSRTTWLASIAGLAGMTLLTGAANAQIAVSGSASAASAGTADEATAGIMGDAGGGGDTLPDSISLTGIVRDFQERNADGHPDFERRPDGGFGQYVGMVQDQLDADGKPVFAGTGVRLSSQWTDGSGRARIPTREYIGTRRGDSDGSLNESNTGAGTTSDNFRQWFRDVEGVNLSRALSLTLVRQDGANVYTFDDKDDSFYLDRGGFFPINGELYGNSAGNDKNFHFTFELATEFVYKRDAGLEFTFRGDDDVWVFIDGKLVIDIGGVHSAVSQTIELDRLAWLEDGETYSLHFFFAERHRTQSNFRIETTLQLRSVEMPATAALYD